jgi:chromosome segregation ATPase
MIKQQDRLRECIAELEDERDRLRKIVDEQCRFSSVCCEYREQRDEARQEVAELKEEYGTWWAQKRIALDELKDVTEQREGLIKRIEQLEDELAKACNKVDELAKIGLDQMDKERSTNKKLSDYRSQRDRMAEALQQLCKALLTANPLDITELLNKAGDALQSLTTPTQTEQTK